MIKDVTEDKLIREVSAPGIRTVMIIGGPDSGKTTLAGTLANGLSMDRGVAVVDLDMGQSSIGPPTTIAWGLVKGGFNGWKEVKAEDFYFTGALSPVGNLLPAIVGAKLMADRAGAAAAKVIIDTTGLIAEPSGRVLKQYKIELLRPDAVVAIEREGELGHILGFLRNRKALVLRLPISEKALERSPTRRADYREGVFRAYFMGSRVVEVSRKKTPLEFTREIIDGAELKGRLASFRDGGGADLALGIIEGVDPKGGNLLVRTPLPEGADYSTLVVGTVKV